MLQEAQRDASLQESRSCLGIKSALVVKKLKQWKRNKTTRKCNNLQNFTFNSYCLNTGCFSNWHGCRASMDRNPILCLHFCTICSNLNPAKQLFPSLGLVNQLPTKQIKGKGTKEIKLLKENFKIKLTILILNNITKNLPVTQFDKSLVALH